MKSQITPTPLSDLTSQGGRAISWHLREGIDNGQISRESLALWIDDICNQHDLLVDDNARLRAALELVATQARTQAIDMLAANKRLVKLSASAADVADTVGRVKP